MARRRKPSGRERKELTSTAHRRRQDTIDPVNSIIIATEDTDSSVSYLNCILNELKKDKRITPSSVAFAKHSHTNPTGVLDDLKAHREISGATYKDFNHKWIVIDRDYQWTANQGHFLADYNDAFYQASLDDVEVAFANDSFELWYVLHFEYLNTSTDRAALNAKLVNYAQACGIARGSLKSKAFAESLYSVIKNLECTAIRNAERLVSQSIAQGKSIKDENPCTTVHRLVCLLRSFGKKCDSDKDCSECDPGCECSCHEVHCNCDEVLS